MSTAARNLFDEETRASASRFARRVKAASQNRKALAASLVAAAEEGGLTDGEKVILLAAAHVLDPAGPESSRPSLGARGGPAKGGTT